MKENGAKKDVTDNHPVHKSLSVFPILSESSNGILANSSANVLAKGKKPKRKKRRGSHNTTKFNTKSKGKIIVPTDGSCDTFETDRDELLYVKHVKEKLDRVSDLLPTVNGEKKNVRRSPLHLPPITTPMQITPQTSGLFDENVNKIGWKSDYHRAFSLPVIPQIEKNPPCTCKKSTSFKVFDKVVKKCNAKEFRAEETPPLFSVHVRWKNQRTGKSEYCQETLREVFGYFGAVSKIILKSKSSAVVVFHHIESAVNADKVMQTMGKEMKMHVKWLNDLKKNNNRNINSN